MLCFYRTYTTKKTFKVKPYYVKPLENWQSKGKRKKQVIK